MTQAEEKAPVLVFGYGNPSRGDDALGPALLDALRESPVIDQSLTEYLTDFQLQIEHATDLAERELVIFADASISSSEPFDFTSLTPDHVPMISTHAITPASVMAVHQQIYSAPLPVCKLLSIRGYRFSLGDPLSESAERNLHAAAEFLRDYLENHETCC